MQVANDIIIEPSTGRVQASFEGYCQVESVWNDTNLWVNLQAGANGLPPCHSEALLLDFADESAWMVFRGKEGNTI